jgi:hypothetical protein
MKREHVRFLFLVTALTGLLSVTNSCGGEGAAYSSDQMVPIQTQDTPQSTVDIGGFLYKGELIKYNKTNQPDNRLVAAVDNLPLNRGSIAEIVFTSLEYTNTNLPAVSVLLVSKTNNGSLIIYNHGHDGLPTSDQAFAIEFINMALSAGYSVLLDSMPLVGLNDRNLAATYYMIPKGGAGNTPIGESLLQWPVIHQLYQAIEGTGNFMHFFVDGSLFAANYFGGARKSRPFYFNGEYSNIQFDHVHYVGLSGGGFAGLISCGLYKYRSCTLVAGFLPFKYKISDLKHWGDSEQWADSFFTKFSYEFLLDRARDSSENFTLIYNSEDPCCFSNPAARVFKEDNPNLKIILNDYKFHGFNPEQVMSLVRGQPG